MLLLIGAAVGVFGTGFGFYLGWTTHARAQTVVRAAQETQALIADSVKESLVQLKAAKQLAAASRPGRKPKDCGVEGCSGYRSPACPAGSCPKCCRQYCDKINVPHNRIAKEAS